MRDWLADRQLAIGAVAILAAALTLCLAPIWW